MLNTNRSDNNVSKRQIVDRALERINSPQGEGKKVFTSIYDDAARAAADFADRAATIGIQRSPL
jgi:hypothetical protein